MGFPTDPQRSPVLRGRAGGELSPITVNDGGCPQHRTSMSSQEYVAALSKEKHLRPQYRPRDPPPLPRSSPLEPLVALFHYTGREMDICGGRVAKGQHFCTKSRALCAHVHELKLFDQLVAGFYMMAPAKKRRGSLTFC